ncbi:hypothetical protein T4B_3380 [Trichinella pseudospiralis]|uniref:Uncharacterized protein n=1 Tax=Trichinella pseudospiralis TaxID=6337 RepID=A0A0V1IYJ3_TRIPS|nr:hypothetical protein T4A_12494 [Trichinella pseudospiralis]KRZ27780.1 hypothetical protein T4B_3380 [Trichinella pseudospiralis]KRZ39188.1 hypothetical protein T4C_1644 [Trichinella pseudospiralis]
MKRLTSSLFAFPDLRPTSATLLAKSQIDWSFRWRSPLKRISSWIGDSLLSRRRLSSCQEISHADPGGKSSRRTASVISRRALATWRADGTSLTRKKSSTVSSHSVGSIPGEKAVSRP